MLKSSTKAYEGELQGIATDLPPPLPIQQGLLSKGKIVLSEI